MLCAPTRILAPYVNGTVVRDQDGRTPYYAMVIGIRLPTDANTIFHNVCKDTFLWAAPLEIIGESDRNHTENEINRDGLNFC